MAGCTLLSLSTWEVDKLKTPAGPPNGATPILKVWMLPGRIQDTLVRYTGSRKGEQQREHLRPFGGVGGAMAGSRLLATVR